MFGWRVRAEDGRELRGDEKKLYVRVRRVLQEYEPLRASHAEMRILIQGTQVRLSGRVRTLPQKAVAVILVRRVEGVGEVLDDLVADAEVIRDVADALALDPRTAPYVIQVEARHGVVYLRGEVPDDAVRRAAVDVSSREALVSAVRDEMQLGGPTYPPFALASGDRQPELAAPATAV